MADESEKMVGRLGKMSNLRDLKFALADSDVVPRDKERGLSLIELREPEWSLDDLVLSPTTRDLLARIVEENRRSQVIRSYGLWPIRKALFWGPPGCGKTIAADAIARELYLPLGVVRFDAVISSYLGETSANLRKVFDFARQRKMVVLFDEFDAIGKMREDRDEHGELKRVVNAFLQMMDGFRAEGLMIAATNHEQLLDSALWRRFDEVVSFARPDKRQLTELVSRNLRQMHFSPQVSMKAITGGMVGMSHADVERIVVNSMKATLMSQEKEISSVTIQSEISKQKRRDDAARASTGPLHATREKTRSRKRNALSRKR